MVQSAAERQAPEASDPETTRERLAELSVNRSPSVRAAVAGNPTAPFSVLSRLADDPRREPRLTVPLLAPADASISALLLGAPHVDVREHLASLASGISEGDRQRGARMVASAAAAAAAAAAAGASAWKTELSIARELRERPALPADVQWALKDDAAWQVRASLARSTELADVFDALLSDTAARVRASCAENGSIVSSQIDRLLTDPKPDVRCAAVFACPLSPGQMMRVAREDRSQEVVDLVVHRRDVPNDVLEWVLANRRDDVASFARSELRDRREFVKTLPANEVASRPCWICGTDMSLEGLDVTPHWTCPSCGSGLAYSEPSRPHPGVG